MGSRTTFLTRFAAVSVFALTTLGCATSSFYKETNHDLHPAPVAKGKVKVYKQKSDIKAEYVELGQYRGKAGTVEEAMETAKRICGEKGGSYYILTSGPSAAGSGYKVDGICAAKAGAKSNAPRKAK